MLLFNLWFKGSKLSQVVSEMLLTLPQMLCDTWEWQSGSLGVSLGPVVPYSASEGETALLRVRNASCVSVFHLNNYQVRKSGLRACALHLPPSPPWTWACGEHVSLPTLVLGLSGCCLNHSWLFSVSLLPVSAERVVRAISFGRSGCGWSVVLGRSWGRTLDLWFDFSMSSLTFFFPTFLSKCDCLCVWMLRAIRWKPL